MSCISLCRGRLTPTGTEPMKLGDEDGDFLNTKMLIQLQWRNLILLLNVNVFVLAFVRIESNMYVYL